MKRYPIAAVAALLVFAGFATAHDSSSAQPAKVAKKPTKVAICHRTKSAKNPYVLIRVRPAVAARHKANHPEDIIPAGPQCSRQRPLTPRRGGTALTAELTGTGGTGNAIIRLRPGQGTVCFRFTLPTGFTFGASHIHRAVVGEPVVVPLTPTATTAAGQTSGCVTADRDVVKEIFRNPAGFLVNLHVVGGPTVVLSGALER